MQVAKQPFKLTDSYTAPKGAFIVPSIWAAAMHGFKDAAQFDPERFGPERHEDVEFANNFLVFGWGPHYCIGKEVCGESEIQTSRGMVSFQVSSTNTGKC